MTQLDITEKTDGDRCVLTIAGPVNSYTYGDLQEKIARAMANAKIVVIDMEKVTNLSSAGIGVLMASLDDAETAGKRIVMLRPSEISRMAFESTGFAERFPMIESLREL
jgi:anti-anti-sigma factor